MAQFAVNKTSYNFKLTENKKNKTLTAKWTILAGFKKKKHTIELIRSNIYSSKPSLSQIVLNGNMIYETIDNQYQFELNIEKDEIDILINQNNNKNKKKTYYYLYINGNEYRDIIKNKMKNNCYNKWICSFCNHSNYKHTKHCRSCRRKKRKKNKIDTNWSNNILIPPIPPPPPPPDIPPPPPLSQLNEQIVRNNKLLNDYQLIINKQKQQISELKTKLLNNNNTKTVNEGANNNQKERNTMQKCVQQTQEKILLFKKSINEINETVDIIENEKHKCIKQIDCVFNKIYKQFQKRKKQIIDKLETMANIKKKILIAQQKQIKTNLKISNKINNELNELLNEKTLKNERKFNLQKMEQKILKVKNRNDTKVSPYLQFKCDKEYKHLLHSINTFGDITNIGIDVSGKRTNGNNIKTLKQNRYIDRWDNEIMGDNIQIHKQNGSIISCNEIYSYGYRSCFGLNVISKGCHHWKLKIISMNENNYIGWNMLIGVLKLNNNNVKQMKIYHRNGNFTKENNGYGFIGNLNCLSNGFVKDRLYGCKLKNGYVIDVYLDLDKLILCYKINNIGYGIAYNNLENGKYCLGVSFCGSNNQIQILKYDHEKYD